jgi:hypothetical protein
VKRLVAALVRLLLSASAAHASLQSPMRLNVPAYTDVGHATYPAVGTLDVSGYDSVAGILGLCPTGQNWQGVNCPFSNGEITLRWYDDPAGAEGQVGVQGLPLTSLIPSNAQLSIPNQGDYLRVEFECFPRGSTCPLFMRLRGTNRAARVPLSTPDTLLVEDEDQPFDACNGTCRTVYPADYYTGPMHAFLAAPAGTTVTLYVFNLELVPRRAGVYGPGMFELRTPGTFFFFVSGPAGTRYTLTVTPDVLGGDGLFLTRGGSRLQVAA